MRFLADENFPGPVIRELRLMGHDLVSAKDSLRGEPDTRVLQEAVGQQRVLLTLDKDFGELAFRRGLPVPAGVILFRLSGETPAVDNARMLSVLSSRDDWAGHFSVVADDLIRMRPLPRSG